MKSVYETYLELWPESSRALLKPLLSKVKVLHLPLDNQHLRSAKPKSVVLVVDNMKIKTLMSLVSMGFNHIVQRNREDFAQELLASSLMIARTEAFFKNPVPFFLSGFNSTKIINDPDRHLIMRFTRQKEKPMLLDWLKTFLDKDPRTSTIRDLCLQSADEMISNALFNAPLPRRGRNRTFKDLPRDTDIQLPASMAATLFACFADKRVIVGCTDCYGSLTRFTLLTHLSEMFNDEGAGFKIISGGAGLGVRNLIENAANYYVLVDPGKFTLMACGFMLKGLKSNLTTAKHIHFNCE